VLLKLAGGGASFVGFFGAADFLLLWTSRAGAFNEGIVLASSLQKIYSNAVVW